MKLYGCGMSGLLSQLSYQLSYKLSYKPVPLYYTQIFQKSKREIH